MLYGIFVVSVRLEGAHPGFDSAEKRFLCDITFAEASNAFLWLQIVVKSKGTWIHAKDA